MVILAPHGEVARTLTVVRLIVSVDAVVGVDFLEIALADKHIISVLPNCVLARHLQRLESFVTHITGSNPLYLSCALSPNMILSSNNKTCP